MNLRFHPDPSSAVLERLEIYPSRTHDFASTLRDVGLEWFTLLQRTPVFEWCIWQGLWLRMDAEEHVLYKIELDAQIVLTIVSSNSKRNREGLCDCFKKEKKMTYHFCISIQLGS